MAATNVIRLPVANAGDDELSSNVAIVGDMLATTQIPDREDGSVDTSDARSQSMRTLQNLKESLESAGSSLEEVAHLTVYLTDIEERHQFNEAYREFFRPPYPVRCTVSVSALAIEGVKVEVTALAARVG